MDLSDKEEENSTKKDDTQEIQIIVDRKGEEVAEEDDDEDPQDIFIPEVNLIQFEGSLQDMYSDMNYPSVFTNLPIKLKRSPQDAFTMNELRGAIRAGVYSAKEYAKHRKIRAYSGHDSEDESIMILIFTKMMDLLIVNLKDLKFPKLYMTLKKI